MIFDTKNIVLLGPPGCGKGTQAKFIKEKNYELIVAGDLLREISSLDTEFGNHIASIIDKGNLVSSDMINEMVSNRIDFIKERGPWYNGIVLDGYPRKMAQSKYLNIVLPLNHVLFFDVDEDVVIERLLERGKVSGRVDDQDESIIRGRMEVYREETLPIKEYYEKKGILRMIDGNQSIDEVKKVVEGFINRI